MVYNTSMFEVKRTDAFDGWLKGLKDSKGRTKIQARIDRLANDNAGDVAPIGEGLSELRIDFGPATACTTREPAGRFTCCYAVATRAVRTRTSRTHMRCGKH
jgi:putative component of toxin-antitoxin plasmid stabilization module